MSNEITYSVVDQIDNPGFETSDWGGNETQSGAEKNTGSYSGKLEATGSDISSAYSNYINVQGWDYLTVASYVKITSLTKGKFYVLLYYYDEDQTELGSENFDNFSSTQGWTQSSQTYNIRADLDKDVCYVRVRFNWWNATSDPTGVAYTDDWQLVQGSNLPTFGSETLQMDFTPQYVYSASTGYKTLISNFESGKEQRRQRWNAPRRTFYIVFNAITETKANEIAELYNIMKGDYGSFTFIEPTASKVYNVRFRTELNKKYITSNLCQLDFELVEVL